MGFFADLTTDDSVETPHLQADVPAGATDHRTVWTVPADATIERMTVWAVPGSEDALQIRPIVERDGEPDQAIPEYSDNREDFITGEPQGDEYRVSQSVQNGDRIVIEADNTGSYAYRYRILPVVDYTAGTSRFLGGVL